MTIARALTLVLSLLLAVPAAAQTTRPTTRPAKPVPLSEVTHWIGLGGGGGRLRQMPPGLLERGYVGVARSLMPLVDVGCRSILFHCPGGTTGETGAPAGMTWDQFPLTEDTPGMPARVSAAEFVKACTMLRARGVKIGIYVGNPAWSPDMVKLRDAGDLKGWWRRWERSFDPIRQIKPDYFYVDALSEVTPNKYPLEYLSMKYAEQLVNGWGGKFCGEEAYFCWNVPEWKHVPGLTAWPLRSDRPVPKGKWCLMFDQFEVVSKDPGIVRRMVELGYTPAVNVFEYAKAIGPRGRR